MTKNIQSLKSWQTLPSSTSEVTDTEGLLYTNFSISYHTVQVGGESVGEG